MEEPQNDPDKPNIVWVRKPGAIPDWARAVVHPDTIQNWVAMKAWAKVGEFAGLVHGRFGDAAEVTGTTGLIRPSAIFRGLNRPLFDGQQHCDKKMLVYVTTPSKTYEFGPKQRHVGCPVAEDAPGNAVFTTFVSFDPLHVDEALRAVQVAAPEGILGVVTHWEWTLASQARPTFPENYSQRYEEHLQ